MQVKKEKLHFIGIGGIGTSALAQYFLSKGCQVSGSDLVSSEMTKKLKKMRAKIFIEKHKGSNLTKGISKVIFSPAVKSDNPELKKAKKLKIKCQSYPESLGELTKKYWTIAISGTHGKSTTTAMIALILIKAGFDPKVILGTKLKEFKNSNFRQGKSKYLVIEADEWQASFLNYWPKIIVLTNIEKEHLDYYKDLGHILRTYREYIGHLLGSGVLVVNRDNKNIQKLLSKKQETRNKKQIKGFSIKQKEAGKIRKILKIPGEHNVANALASLAVARVLGISDRISFQALSEYRGAWRRFEVSTVLLRKREKGKKGEGGKGKEKKGRPITDYRLLITIINDYAHHPTEIAATLKAAREKYSKQKIWCIFQPHQYQRTFYLFDDFVKVFKKAPVDKLIITDIYDVVGRENREIKKKVDSKKLVKAIVWGRGEVTLPVLYLPKEKIIDYLKKNLKGGEVVILMGAGDVYNLGTKL